MDDAHLAEHFEGHRPRLRAVAYRMLGSLAEADDAVQDAWLRLHASDTGEIDNLGGWLTTVVARECLHQLRSRRHRREDPLPDPVVVPDDNEDDPEQVALRTDSVSLALLVVLDRLTPAERLAFVLHDTFDVPFETVADVLGRTPAAARQLASRARRRVHGAGLHTPDPDLATQRRVVAAFYAAAREGDFAALVEVLAPEVVLRTDDGPDRPPLVLRGVPAVARLARAPRGAELRPAIVNGVAGAVISRAGRPYAIVAFTVVDGRIVAIDGLRDPHRVARLARDRPQTCRPICAR